MKDKMVVTYSVTVEYGKWWNGDTSEWMSPTTDIVKDDGRYISEYFGDCFKGLKIHIDDDIV